MTIIIFIFFLLSTFCISGLLPGVREKNMCLNKKEGKEVGRSPGRLEPGHTGGMTSHQESGPAQRFGIPLNKIKTVSPTLLPQDLAGNILSLLYVQTTFQSGCLTYLHLSLGFAQTFPMLPLTKGGHDFFY